MRILRSRSIALTLFLASLGVVFWATSSLAAKPEGAMLPGKTEIVQEDCLVVEVDGHKINIEGLGDLEETPDGRLNQLSVRFERPYINKSGLKAVPFRILSIGGTGFIEGLGETRFWIDATRPVTSAIWEKRAGTEFPAVQEMRFHFFYTFEGIPGKVYRSMNPAIMRSDSVRSFPPPPGTSYRLAQPVRLEDISNPGVVAGTVVSNRAEVPRPRRDRDVESRNH